MPEYRMTSPDRPSMLPRRAAVSGLIAATLLPATLLAAAPALAKPYILHPEAFPDPVQGPTVLPTWRRNAIAVTFADDRPKIAIVVDDMGAMHPFTERVVALPAPLTLSWFPFAANLPEQIAAAAARGHEATLHMPMQASSNSILQTGPDPLRVDLPPAVNLARLRAALDAVPNTVGLNNHMGTVATRDAALMDIVAAEARDRGMLFLDSVTIPHSVALARAEIAGVPAAARDVFIDHAAAPDVIREQLAEIEATSRRLGYAIAIGHPRENTIAALEAWLPTLAAKGFVMWPISATVALRNKIDLTATV
jgi:polysaccharide deacetylase 2 family uncharacterized protein YibQ